VYEQHEAENSSDCGFIYL